MVVVDDVLMFPFRSLLWIFREIHHAAQEELVNAADSITAELSNLYMMLETGRISEQEFAAEEKILLERLEGIQKRRKGVEADDGAEELPEPAVKGRVA